jgi:hypothetical protein
MAKRKRNFNRTYHFRLDDPRRELLARRAFVYNPEDQSIQTELEREAFPVGWDQELEALRIQQRQQGISDSRFMHTRKLKSLGYRINYGRRRKIVPPRPPAQPVEPAA